MAAIKQENIPKELRNLKQWVCWQIQENDAGKLTKVPKIAWNKNANASITKPQNWTGFDVALDHFHQGHHDGVGFVFSKDNPYCGIDLDSCRDPETGTIDPWAREILDRTKSYAEVSQSGKGIHIIARARLPGSGIKRKLPGTDHEVEIYDQGRFFIVTGLQLTGYPPEVEERQEEISQLYQDLTTQGRPAPAKDTPQKPRPISTISPPLTDDEVIRRASEAANGDKFQRLMTGDISEYPSESEADGALVMIVGFYTQNYDQILRIIQRSELWDAKWEREDYCQRTISSALQKMTEFWSQGTATTQVTSESKVEAIKLKPVPEPFPEFNTTDIGNGERLAHYHGEDIRYCHPQRKWYLWNGRRWKPDDSGEIKRLAKDVVKWIYREAGRCEDEERRKAIADHARKSESNFRIKAMIEMANSELGIPVTPDQLDVSMWLLNCQNGTLDLRTGELLPHSREHLITKITLVEYDQYAKLPLWDEFLRTATDDNEELIAFLQRAVGYSLTGNTGEEKLFFVHGPEAAGKSTFVESVKAMIGDYAITADFETFLQRREVGTARNDVAALAGARLVASIEVDEGKRLAEGLIKILTGGDTVRARFLYQESFEFLPQFKLWLCANHEPQIRAEDGAMWRRVLKLPFEHSIPRADRDPQVKATLKNPEIAGPAILAWAVEGCLRWQEYGLDIPPVVEKATDKYRADMDVIGAFVEECCIIDRNAFCLKKDLYETYVGWCRDSGVDTISKPKFGKRLVLSRPEVEGGVGTANVYIWRGIGLLKEVNEST